MKRSIYLHVIIFCAALAFQVATAGSSTAVDPTATTYDFRQCEGSLTPYPLTITPVEYPDSLTPVFINHVGRHGSRFPASATHCLTLQRALHKADSLGTITSKGKKLLHLTDYIIELSTDQWGALDSLGMAEQRGIASRMFAQYTPVFKNACVSALSSYSPRCMMSMYTFTHQLDRLDNHIEFSTSTGRANSALMRPFDTVSDYVAFRKSGIYSTPYNDYFNAVCPTAPIENVLGKGYPYGTAADKRDLAITEYYVIAGCAAMGVDIEALQYFTLDEYNALWSCFNLRQYLQRSTSTLSTIPADIAADLILNLVSTTDGFIDGTNKNAVCLRFGHAETILPLVSLLRLPGCYYLTNYFDTVALHWKDFDIVPMAANVQMILFKSATGRYYLRTDLNERPVQLIPNNPSLYLPWEEARSYMMRCVPLYAQ